MALSTIQLFERSAIAVTNLRGNPPRNGDVINNAQNGNAFSWEVPDNLKFVFPTTTVALSFHDDDGMLSDDPYGPDASGSQNVVVEQFLGEQVTLNGETYVPNGESVRWKYPPPVTVEAEYSVVLYDAAGQAYTMVGVAITQHWQIKVVGVFFDGAQPPAGQPLYYIQGVSTYNGHPSVPIPGGVTCFLAGTLIDTPRGPRPIESLAVGDRILTLDGGICPVRWIGRSRVAGDGDLAPVRIMAGAMGNRRDLWVSPNHRILVRAAQAELHFGGNEVLVAAKHLVDGDLIRRDPMQVADYLHLALDTHEMVFSEGIASETLSLGPMALTLVGPEARAELSAIFPGLEEMLRVATPASQRRPSLTRGEAALLRSWWRPERVVANQGRVLAGE